MPGSPAKSPIGEFFIFYYPGYTIFLIKSYLHADVSYYAEIGTTKEIGDVCTRTKKKDT